MVASVFLYPTKSHYNTQMIWHGSVLVLSGFGAISFELMGWEIAVGGTPLGDTTMKVIFIAIVLVVILTQPLY